LLLFLNIVSRIKPKISFVFIEKLTLINLIWSKSLSKIFSEIIDFFIS
jgi:hypothetical protein